MKKNPLLLIEIIAVVSILTILIYFGVNKYSSLFNNFPRYKVEFNDIDGLSIGSPVRLAGVHVGHVVKQELKGDKVLVTFKVINKNAKIPPGSRAGVEFYGLVGSKSIEIRPPDVIVAGDQLLKPVDPLRIERAKDLLNILSETTLDISEAILDFLDKNAENAGGKLKETSKAIKEKAKQFEHSGIIIEQNSRKTIDNTKKIKDLVKETSESIGHVKQVMGDFAGSEEVKDGINKLKETTDNIADFIEKDETQMKITELTQKMKNFNKKVKEVNEKIDGIKNRELGYINEFNESIQKTTVKMQKLIDALEKRKNTNKE